MCVTDDKNMHIRISWTRKGHKRSRIGTDTEADVFGILPGEGMCTWFVTTEEKQDTYSVSQDTLR
jgi:hypothetical protein